MPVLQLFNFSALLSGQGHPAAAEVADDLFVVPQVNASKRAGINLSNYLPQFMIQPQIGLDCAAALHR